ncbi:cytochrome c peroxidase [Thiomicrospira sp. R3]|uniref:cytochrome-c peroxidase n=1 Tax=Thiomicrospira sp. R3 TaxID=3035472 RepID=UPI00259B9955|nr:cytochrome c peroxidase [Thiomicrospira sp. R3]WFE69440.1 cytochrome c peroxidase [Thiomicrospira sp. R3]
MLGRWYRAGFFFSTFLLIQVSSAHEGKGVELTKQQIFAQYLLDKEVWPKPHLDEGVMHIELASLPEVSYPKGNLYSDEKYQLGRHLFFDPRLSRSGQIACASCHEPQLGWADGKRFSHGHNRAEGTMNSPTILYTGHLSALFWDGRAKSLEAVAIDAMTNPIEMAADEESVVKTLGSISGYQELFRVSFPGETISFQTISKALATFIRGQNPDTPFDRFMRGNPMALNEDQIHGMHLFRTKARCMNCHQGAMLTDQKFHHLGTSFYGVDGFRGRASATGDLRETGQFRTQPLRAATITPPFMHNGLVNSLPHLIEMYSMGWWQNNPPSNKSLDDKDFPKLSPHIQALELTKDEKKDLESFLHALSPSVHFVATPQYLPSSNKQELKK